MARQCLRDYQNHMDVSPLEFARVACDVARHNPLYMEWAKMAVFAVLPTIKLDNPEKFARSFQTEEDMRKYMLPLWCLLSGDGVDLRAAHESFVRAARTHLDRMTPDIDRLTREMDELTEARHNLVETQSQKPSFFFNMSHLRI